MPFPFPARANWRGLTASALIGAGLGLGLGAGYMTLSSAHARAERDAMQAALTRAYLAPRAAPTATPVAVSSVARPAIGRGRDLDCLTATVYYEARGETARGQAAVAQVVLNRVRHPAFPKTVCGVVYQGAGSRGCQFSFACDGVVGRGRETAAWRRAREIATQALGGSRMSDIGMATHFHVAGVATDWGPQMFRTAQVGLHVFYRLAPRREVAQVRERGDARLMMASLASGPAPETAPSLSPSVEAAKAEPAPKPETAEALAEPAAKPAP